MTTHSPGQVAQLVGALLFHIPRATGSIPSLGTCGRQHFSLSPPLLLPHSKISENISSGEDLKKVTTHNVRPRSVRA